MSYKIQRRRPSSQSIHLGCKCTIYVRQPIWRLFCCDFGPAIADCEEFSVISAIASFDLHVDDWCFDHVGSLGVGTIPLSRSPTPQLPILPSCWLLVNVYQQLSLESHGPVAALSEEHAYAAIAQRHGCDSRQAIGDLSAGLAELVEASQQPPVKLSACSAVIRSIKARAGSQARRGQVECETADGTRSRIGRQFA